MSNAVAEYRDMDLEALILSVGRVEQELLELKEAVRIGKEKNHARLRIVKSEVARAKTVLKEKSSK